MTFPIPIPLPAVRRAASLVALLLAVLVAGPVARAQEPPPAPASPAPAAAPARPDAAEPAPKADPEPVQPAAEAPARAGTEGRRVRLDQVVAVGNDTVVRANEEADEVVVVRGDATLDGDVRGDVVVVLGKVTVNGRIGGDLVVVLGEARVNGEVKGDLSLVLTRGRFLPKANVRGHVMAVGTAPEIDPAASLRGSPEVISLGPLMTYFEWARDYLFEGVFLLRPFPPRLGWVWVVAGVFLVLHLALALLLAAPMRACMTTLQEQPARSFLVGLLACILVGPVSLLLSFTVVATPLIWLVFFALCLFGRVAAYGATGEALGRLRAGGASLHPVPAVLVGSVLYYLVYMVPVLGFLVYFLVLPWGVGAALIRVFEAVGRERRPAPPFRSGPGVGPGAGPVPVPPSSYPAPAAAGSGSPGAIAAGSAPADSAYQAVQALTSGTPGPATHATVDTEAVPSAAGISAAESEPPPISHGPPPPPSAPSPLPPPPPAPPLSPVEVAALPRVGFWPRFGATAIDLIGVAFLTAMTSGEARAFWFLLAAYHFGMWGWRGTTLGGSILRLKVIRLDGRPLDWPTAGVRVLGSVLSLLPLGLGFFWASWDDDCQSWHDRIAGTTVVRSDRRVPIV